MQTECRQRKDESGVVDCRVKKQVRCLEMCKFMGFDKHKFPAGVMRSPKTADCDASLCEGKFGAIACAPVARME